MKEAIIDGTMAFDGFAFSVFGGGRWRVEKRVADILAIWEAHKGISLEELRLALAEIGLIVSVAGLHRFFVHRGMMRKKD